MFGILRKKSPCNMPEMTVRKIASLNECCALLSQASAHLSKVQQETRQLIAGIEELQRVSKPLPENAKMSIQRLECASAVDRCAESCESLEQDLRTWTKSGGNDALSSTLRPVRQQIRLATCTAEITSAKDIVSLAISVIKLHAPQQTSPAATDEKNPMVLSMHYWMRELSDKSRAAYCEAEGLAREMETQYARALTRNTSGDPRTLANVASSLEQVERQKQAYARLLRSCDVAMGAVV